MTDSDGSIIRIMIIIIIIAALDEKQNSINIIYIVW